MKTSHIIATMLLVVSSVLGLVLWNAFKVERTFTVLYNHKLGICFLLDNGYQYHIRPNTLAYGGGKNSGEIKLVQGNLNPSYKFIDVNGLQASYMKRKNQRVFEYKLNADLKLVDHFVNAQKMPVNLVPYRDECQKIMKNFKEHVEIFKGV